ncbi:MAG: LexA family transcriptional regulator [bacterium]
MDPKSHFQKIISFYHRRKRMPSYSEILKETGLRSKNAAFKLVSKLVGENLLEKDSSGKLLPTSCFNEIMVLGTVEAGFPALAEQQQLDTITLDEFLIKNRSETYMLEVSGDSMTDAGILPRDLVLVERGKAAKAGDIVIAQVDGQWTIKYLRKKNNKIFLEPANKKYRPIFPRHELYIAAVVQAVIRKYR